jgi:ADP-heptose:LPS heptosyltransferase
VGSTSGGSYMPMVRMRDIDNWIGLPLCLCVGVVVRLLAALRTRRRDIPASPRRIVVMKFFGMGSVIQASAMLRAIREHYPRSALIFLTFDRTAGPLERMGVCSEVRQVRTDGVLSFGWDVLRQVATLIREPADVCIDLEVFSKFSTLMSVISRAPVRVAFHLNSFWRYSLVTHPVYYNYYRHVSDVYNDAAAAIGVTVSDPRPCRLTLEPGTMERCRQRLRDAGWNGSDRLVAVNINAGELSFERRWPRERFAAIIERLVTHAGGARPGLRVVLTGAPDEAHYVGDLVSALNEAAQQQVLNLAGRLSFDEFVASMDLYDLLLTNDSGPLHLAFAQGLATVSLWGPGRPRFYGPPRGPHTTLYNPLPCSPCLYVFTSEAGKWCNHRGDCMRAIEVDDVWTAVQAQLDRTHAARLQVATASGS